MKNWWKSMTHFHLMNTHRNTVHSKHMWKDGKMKKGMIVLAKAEVMTGYSGDFIHSRELMWEGIHTPHPENQNSRNLYRQEWEVPCPVILLGKTTIQTGMRKEPIQYVDDYEPPTLIADKHHRVWAVCSYSPTDNRYTSPFYVLENDLVEEEE